MVDGRGRIAVMSDELRPSAQAALQALHDQRGPCPGAVALVAYDALPADARWSDPIHAHVQACSRCQLVLHHLYEPAPAPARVWTMRVFVSAAAVVLLAVLVPRMVSDRSSSAPPPP